MLPALAHSFEAITIEAEFAAFIAASSYPCLGAKAALNSGSYTLRVYEQLGSKESAEPLAHALQEFVQSEMYGTAEFATFLAVFREPEELTEEQFEELLWFQLRELHRVDALHHAWDRKVASDPSDPRFSFSIAGRALYVVGMHRNSSRLARRFRWPTLIFNPHEQFERLRQEGKWERWQRTIRARDVSLQGCPNPMLNDFGDKSEARQYAGRSVEANWTPPFQPTEKAANSAEASQCPFAH